MRSLTVSLVAGCVVERDAISNVCRQQVAAIERFARANSMPISLKVYTGAADVSDTRIVEAPNVLSVAVDEHFLRSDVVVFNFGIFYPLFDAIHLAPPLATTAVLFYGITPPHLLTPDQRQIAFDSYRQAVNIHAADQVLTTSDYLVDELHANLGVPLSDISKVPLCASFGAVREGLRPPGEDGTIRLLYLGRFHRAKGVHELLQAFQRMDGRRRRRVRLDLVGSARWAEPDYLAELEEFVTTHGLNDSVDFHSDISKECLVDTMLNADALVIPSHHEGFCVPVIEALDCGCCVICSDAGSLGEVSGGLGRTFPAGNSQALAAMLDQFTAEFPDAIPTDSGLLKMHEWRARASSHAARFTRERFEESFCEALFGNLKPRREEDVKLLANTRGHLLRQLCKQAAREPISNKCPRFLQDVLHAAGRRTA